MTENHMESQVENQMEADAWGFNLGMERQNYTVMEHQTKRI